LYRGFGVNAEFARDFVGGLDDIDDDIGGVRQLRRPGLESELGGLENLKAAEPGEGDFGGANELLHGGGVLEKLELRLNHPILGLGVAANQHIVDADRDQLRSQTPGEGFQLRTLLAQTRQ